MDNPANFDDLAKLMSKQQTGPPANDANNFKKSKTKPGEKFDIYKVDYAWVDEEDDKREMKLAYDAMKEDGGFPDLTAYCLKKLKKLDPKFKTEADFNNYTPQEEREANDDVLDFLSDMKKADNQLRRNHEQSQAIFESGKENTSEQLNSGYAG